MIITIILIVFIIGCIVHTLLNIKKIGTIESNYDIGGIENYYKVTIVAIIFQSVIWPLELLCWIGEKAFPTATEEEYLNQYKKK